MAELERRRGLLLDVDGTLVDNSYFHAVAWFRACREFGVTMSMARLHRLVGMGGDRYTDELLGEHRDDITEAHDRHVAPFFDEMVPAAGALDLLRRSRAAGLRTVLASSASAGDLERLVAILGAADLIDDATSSSDARSSKPAPDLVEVALQRSGLRAADSVFVGDTRWDVEAAGRAGVPCVAVLTGGWSKAELLEAGAVGVCEDAAALVADFDVLVLKRISE